MTNTSIKYKAMPRRERSLQEQCKRVLLQFMRFRDGVDYNNDHHFTNA